MNRGDATISILQKKEEKGIAISQRTSNEMHSFHMHAYILITGGHSFLCIYMNSWRAYNEMHLSTERMRCSNSPENVQHDFPEVHVGGGSVGEDHVIKKNIFS